MLTILFILLLYFTSCDDSSNEDNKINSDTTKDATIIYYRCRTNKVNSKEIKEEEELGCINTYDIEN